MSGEVWLDTGPLVAYLDARQQSHEWATIQFSALTEPLFICEAVVSEVCFLLADKHQAVAKVGDFLRRGALKLTPIGTEAQPRIFALMEKYRQIPMSYADACLVWLAESSPRSKVFTLDSDFAVYRMDRARPVPLIAPF